MIGSRKRIVGALDHEVEKRYLEQTHCVAHMWNHEESQEVQFCNAEQSQG